jgi:hypothetical protein
MQPADDKLRVNCECNVEKIVFVSVEQNYFFDISFTIEPHLSSASLPVENRDLPKTAC